MSALRAQRELPAKSGQDSLTQAKDAMLGPRRPGEWMRDEVNEPLGLAIGGVPGGESGRGLWRALAAAAVLAAAIGFLANARREAGLTREPIAAAKVEIASAAPAPAPPAEAAADAGPPGIASADQVEAASGVKVTRSGGAEAPRGVIIDVAQAFGASLEAAPDERLIEKSRSRRRASRWSRSPP